MDVTERGLTAESARPLESRYRRFVERNAAAVLCSAVDGRILECNEALANLLGYDSPAEVKQHRTPEFYDDPGGHEEIIEALKEKKAVTGYEIRFKRKDGTPIWCLANANLVEADGLDGDVVEGTLIDITGRQHAEEAVHRANLRLRQLAGDLLRSQDYERRRIAKELHDGTAQLLAALNMTLCHLRDAELTPDRKGVLLDEAIGLASQSSREMRVLSYLLHPPLLDELGIAGALASYAEGFRQHSGIEIEVDVAPDFGRLDQDVEIVLFRIVQEGLANLGRREGDVLAAIRLERCPCEVRLELKEFHRGFSAHPVEPGRIPPPLGVGILGMRERAEQFGGRLEITSTDVGTTLAVTLPLSQSDEKDAHTGGG